MPLPCQRGSRRSQGRGRVELRYDKGSVEVLSELNDFTACILQSPDVNPVRGFVLATFRHHEVVSKRSDGIGDEGKMSVCGAASEQRHQVLAGGGAMEPPVQVGNQDPLHRVCISRPQRVIEPPYHPFVIFLRCSRRAAQYIRLRQL